MVKTGQQWSGLFVTKGATGALVTPSVGPAGALYVDGVANIASVTISGSNPYKWTVTLPALTAGQIVSMYITATVSTIATASVVAEDVADTYLVSDVIADTNDIQTRLPAALVSGRIDASVGAMANGTITAAAIATGAVDADALATDAVDEIVDQVWDEINATHAIAGSTGANLTTAASSSGATPASLWAYSSRTLTQTAAQVTAAIAGSDITILRGDTVTIALTGLGALTGYVSLDWTVKADVSDVDSAAILRVRKNASGLSDGLITINGATATTAAQASITIDDAALGNITITLTDDATVQLSPRRGLVYDVQMITATTTRTLTDGDATITGDVTRTLI